MGNTVFSCSSNDGELLVAGGNDGGDNEAPLAQSFSMRVDESVPTEGSLRASDPDGDELAFRIVSDPTLGIVDLLDTRTGAFAYTSVIPGVDSFAYVASEGRHDSNVATVTVEVGVAAAFALADDVTFLYPHTQQRSED